MLLHFEKLFCLKHLSIINVAKDCSIKVKVHCEILELDTADKDFQESKT